MDTLKEEIEKILDDATTPYEGGCDFDHEVAILALEKLFLTKQIELLEGIITGSGWVATCNKLRATITQLQSELKEL